MRGTFKDQDDYFRISRRNKGSRHDTRSVLYASWCARCSGCWTAISARCIQRGVRRSRPNSC